MRKPQYKTGYRITQTLLFPIFYYKIWFYSKDGRRATEVFLRIYGFKTVLHLSIVMKP